MTNRTDVTIIGAGLAGLTAAAVAATNGATVNIVEGKPIGGRARTTKRDGFQLNLGPHALYDSGPAANTLSDLGVVTKGGHPNIGCSHVMWDGEIHRLPTSGPLVLRSKFLSARSKLDAAQIFAAPKRLAHRAVGLTVAEWYDRENLRPDLQRMLNTLFRLASYFASPENAPAQPMLSQLARSSEGVTYLDGGWQTIVDQLDAITANAGAIRHSSAAVSVEKEGGEWITTTDDDTVLASHDLVVATGSPSSTSTLVGEGPDWVELAGPPTRAACLDLGVTYAADTNLLLSSDDKVYFSQHAPAAKLAPAGAYLYSALRYLDPDREFTADESRSMLESRASDAGIDVTNTIVSRFLANMVVAHGSHIVEHPRPRGDELANQNLHVAGDWIGEFFLADASIESARRAALACLSSKAAA